MAGFVLFFSQIVACRVLATSVATMAKSRSGGNAAPLTGDREAMVYGDGRMCRVAPLVLSLMQLFSILAR
jgi:hypothetical protein